MRGREIRALWLYGLRTDIIPAVNLLKEVIRGIEPNVNLKQMNL
jgi:hypothetical protein